MKHYLTILFLACGVWISAAQTNDITNTVAGATADLTTNATTNAVAEMPALASTNSITAGTNHPAASRPKEKITIHSEGPYEMDLNNRWITYQDRVRVTDQQMVMTCDWLMANLPQNNEHITNIVAQTNVIGDFTDDKNQKWHVTGDKGVYAYHVVDGVTNETITLTGNPPQIQEGQDTNTMTGDAIVYNIVTKKVTIKNPTSVFWYGTNSVAGTNSMAPKF
ncbi:MAG TPA: LptA/OstA family protein [Pseudomonadales bacterium]|nr:LptA/OstA family protein [Pseudomonadales bacterium]